MDKIGFWACAGAVLLMELPCLLRTMALQANNQSVWPVVWGTILGNAFALLVGIALARAAARLPEGALGYVHTAAGLVLIGLGAYMIFFDKH